jgi:hypothetical protein
MTQRGPDDLRHEPVFHGALMAQCRFAPSSSAALGKARRKELAPSCLFSWRTDGASAVLSRLWQPRATTARKGPPPAPIHFLEKIRNQLGAIRQLWAESRESVGRESQAVRAAIPN